jgi:hypothetical protein
MGKRSEFPRRERDFYPTPPSAIDPLIPFLGDIQYYAEPMAGDGSLVKHLDSTHMECVWSSDIEPQSKEIRKLDAFDLEESQILQADAIITNPPWHRPMLHETILHFVKTLGKPTWLLFDHDWSCTKQSAPYMEHCRKVVAVGRVKWIPNTPHTSKDSVCWYYFTQQRGNAPRFYGRGLKEERRL